MLGVAAVDKRIATAADKNMIGIENLTVEVLIKAKDEAARRYEDLKASFSHFQTGIEAVSQRLQFQMLSSMPAGTGAISENDRRSLEMDMLAMRLRSPQNYKS